MSRTRKEYTKAFEDYWSRSAQDCGSVELWQHYRIKHMTWLAWQAGRKRLKEELANG